jgi:hypothetical protein
VRTIINQNGQFILTVAEVLAALGIPATAKLTEIQLDTVNGLVTFIANQQVSDTGTP